MPFRRRRLSDAGGSRWGFIDRLRTRSPSRSRRRRSLHYELDSSHSTDDKIRDRKDDQGTHSINIGSESGNIVIDINVKTVASRKSGAGSGITHRPVEVTVNTKSTQEKPTSSLALAASVSRMPVSYSPRIRRSQRKNLCGLKPEVSSDPLSMSKLELFGIDCPQLCLGSNSRTTGAIRDSFSAASRSARPKPLRGPSMKYVIGDNSNCDSSASTRHQITGKSYSEIRKERQQTGNEIPQRCLEQRDLLKVASSGRKKTLQERSKKNWASCSDFQLGGMDKASSTKSSLQKALASSQSLRSFSFDSAPSLCLNSGQSTTRHSISGTSASDTFGGQFKTTEIRRSNDDSQRSRKSNIIADIRECMEESFDVVDPVLNRSFSASRGQEQTSSDDAAQKMHWSFPSRELDGPSIFRSRKLSTLKMLPSVGTLSENVTASRSSTCPPAASVSSREKTIVIDDEESSYEIEPELSSLNQGMSRVTHNTPESPQAPGHDRRRLKKSCSSRNVHRPSPQAASSGQSSPSIGRHRSRRSKGHQNAPGTKKEKSQRNSRSETSRPNYSRKRSDRRKTKHGANNEKDLTANIGISPDSVAVKSLTMFLSDGDGRDSPYPLSPNTPISSASTDCDSHWGKLDDKFPAPPLGESTRSLSLSTCDWLADLSVEKQ